MKLPIIGSVLTRIILARFARTFAIMVRSGITLTQGIRLVAVAAGNAYATQCINDMGEGVEHGENLTVAACPIPVYFTLVLKMISVGEQTGSLDMMLAEVGKFYEREVEYDLKKLADSN